MAPLSIPQGTERIWCIGGKIKIGENQGALRKKKLTATSSTTNPIAPEHDQGLRGEKPATDSLGHCSSLATDITLT